MLSAHNIVKSFAGAHDAGPVLKNVSLNVGHGEFISVVGRSGSGKTTLLNVLSTLVRPDSGEVRYGRENLAELPDQKLNTIRQSDFAVIFQFHHLLPYLTVIENTLLPFMSSIRPVDRKTRERGLACLKRVGLLEKADRLPGSLSGGEQQRVAIARALVKSSRILFADEPTGSLDRATSEEIMELLAGLHAEGLSIVMVTHDHAFAGRAQRVIEMEDGRILN